MRMEYYPEIAIARNITANRFYAFPIIGFIVKCIFTIPVGIELAFLGIAVAILTIINSFVVISTGKYWKVSYDLNLGIIRLSNKVLFYFSGLTDTYPGFDFSIKNFTTNIAYPTQPNRLFAFPIFGGLVRLILLIPFLIFEQVIANSSWIGMVCSFWKVLTTGKYPESTYEFGKDSARVSNATKIFLSGMSDNYPSFKIDLKNHRNIKIILIILGVLFSFSKFTGDKTEGNKPKVEVTPTAQVQLEQVQLK